jgi:hypothetical protein
MGAKIWGATKLPRGAKTSTDQSGEADPAKDAGDGVESGRDGDIKKKPMDRTKNHRIWPTVQHHAAVSDSEGSSKKLEWDEPSVLIRIND